MKLLLCLVSLTAAFGNAFAIECGPELGQALIERNATDQAARKALVASPPSEEALDTVLRIDAENTAYMRRVLDQCGWPRKSVVGPEAAKAAWRLTQHADMDPEFQVLASRQLKSAVLAEEAEPWDLAVLVDRNRRLNDLPQVYGMQFFTAPDGAIAFYSIVSPAQLDQRRKDIGLPSFFCWASQLSRRNHGAAIHWPAGILLRPEPCEEASQAK